ncbi:MAG: hypothetical protein HGA22_14030 [Clostridiales bacterium]|nr:hypothetical protein [Clostridiales bacterium]
MGFGLRINFVDVICDGSLGSIYTKGVKSGYRFDIRLSYYRGMYLSCIESFELKVDGQPVPKQDISFNINNKALNVFQLSDCITEFWRLTDPATIEVFKLGGLNESEHKLELVLMLRSPYMPLPGAEGQRMYMPIDCCGEKMLRLNDAFQGGAENE